jgi:ATP phosphoribosyltransferase regulatory subunit HisZ
VSAVLVTCTAAVAAVTFLITAFLLLALGGRPYISEGLAVAGLIAAVLAAAGAAGDLGHTLVRVLRHRSAGRAEEPDDAAPNPARAREEWELALLERGVLPFLLGRLEEDLNREGRPGRRSGSSGLTQGRHRARASGDR